MGKYGDFSAKHSLYLNVDYGETKKVRWVKDGVEGVNSYGSSCMVFEFDEGNGPKKMTLSPGLVRQFDNYQIGDDLTIKRNLKNEKPMWAIYKEGEEVPF